MKLLYQLPAHLGLPAAWSTRTGHCRPQKERSCSPGWCHELRFVQHGSVRCYPPCCQYHCPTTSSKKVLYRLGNKYTDQQSATAGLYWLSPTQGFEIGGSPVSIPQYMSSHLNKCADGLLQSSPALKNSLIFLSDHPRLAFNLCMRLSASTPLNNCAIISAILSHLPLPYLDIAIANTVLGITNGQPYIPPFDSENIRWWILPDGHHRQLITTPSLTEFYTSLEILHAFGVTVHA